MAASATGLDQAFAFDNNTSTLAAVGGADQAFPSINSGLVQNGIDGTTVPEAPQNGGVGLVAGDHYSLWSGDFAGGASYDLSAVNSSITFHFRNLSPGYTAIAQNADSVWLIVFSGGGTTNYGRWHYDGTTLRNGDWHILTGQGTPDATGGTFDNTNITGVGVAVESEGNDLFFGFQIAIDQCVIHEGDVLLEDAGGAATVGALDYYDLLKATGGQPYHSLLYKIAGTTLEAGTPIDIRSDDYDDTPNSFGFGFKDGDGVGYPDMPSGFFRFLNTGQAAGLQDYGANAVATLSTPYDLIIDGSAVATTMTYSNRVFSVCNNVDISGAGLSFDNCSVVSPIGTVDVSDYAGSLTITGATLIDWNADLTAGASLTTDSDINIAFAETDLSDITITLTATNTVTVNPTTAVGTYDLSGLTTTGTVNLDNGTANDTTVVLPSGTSFNVVNPTTGGGAIQVDSPPATFTFNSDTTDTLIRYFEDGSQTVVDQVTGTTLDYLFPDSDPVDAEFLKQGYVPINRQDVIPTDGGSLDAFMDLDEAYNASHGLVIGVDYTYDRLTGALSITADQQAFDVRSALADVIRTNASYFNTKLLMVAIPGLTRVDLTEDMSITSMDTWKGAGMEKFTSADDLNPLEKWYSIKSVGAITGAAVHYRQTDSGDSTAVTLTNNVVDEAFQYWDDPDHDGTPVYDYSDYMIIKSFLAGSKQGRVDVPANAGEANLRSNLYTVPLANVDGGYSGIDPGITADLTLVAGGTVGGVVFAYEWIDGGVNSGEDIANQINFNAANNPNAVIAGGTGLRYFELGDMVIHNATAVETERGFMEGATPTQVGFYVSRGGSDHPDFTRFQGDNGDYYTPAALAGIACPNFPKGRVRLTNVTTGTYEQEFTFGAGAFTHTWLNGTDFSDGDEGLIQFCSELENDLAVRFFATAATIQTFLNEPETDESYAAYNVDGSTVTEFSFDEPNFQIDIDSASGFSPERLWAYYKYERENTAGLLDTFFNLLSSPNPSLIEINVDVQNAYIDNVRPESIAQNFSGAVNGYIIFRRSDGAYPQVPVTSGGGGIGMYHLGQGFGSTTNTGSGLSPVQDARLFATALESTAQTIITDIDAIPDDILDRNLAGGLNGGRTIRDALRANRNRVVYDPVGNTLTVYEEDDTTVAWSASTTQGARDPINSVDPA